MESRPKRIAIAAMGTGGHIYPGIEIARKLREQGHEVLFVGTTDRMEKELVPAQGFPIELIRAEPFAGEGVLGKIRALVNLVPATAKSFRILRDFKADGVVGTGAYGSVPVALAAKLRGLPLVVYEPNGHPGLANRVLSWLADSVFTPFSAFVDRFPKSKVKVGAVVKKEALSAERNLGRNGFTVWVFGGSQGSRVLNQAVVEALPHLEEGIRVSHMTGRNEFDAVRRQYPVDGGHRVVPYVDDVGNAYGEADVIVMRGGATSLTEISVFRDPHGKSRPVIAVPFEGQGGQQTTPNVLAEKGALLVIPQSRLSGPALAQAVNGLYRDGKTRKALADALAGQVTSSEGAHAIAGEIVSLAERRNGEKIRQPR
ncbi:UDP-N-acetylglucosamine--N-acetylmuramyl-(pentapeptide) pyrophosphoryl-undecaprenol N-acetylglucosamine transferase [Candidatus Micrarchaeota archaeon]|nr:UDP-N-acetylglucosamine--N-acetylmuramyl-(pentapeptide) pyrophosphoryl-undecaprenol N-acetylglucosamine transferase [Candidatus Micrarchaeota archaeon]